MSEIMEPYYVSMLKGHGFTPDPDDHQYGALGLCWKLSPEIGEGSYWTYGQKDLYDIKIHNFSFHEDSLLEFSLPECLSITRYDSISGEELAPYRRLSAGCIKTYIGGNTEIRWRRSARSTRPPISRRCPGSFRNSRTTAEMGSPPSCSMRAR